MRNRIVVALVGLLAFAGLGLAAPSPAVAAPGVVPIGYGMDLATGKVSKPTAQELAYLAISCASGYICFVEHNPPGGAAYPVSQSTTSCQTMPSWMDGRTSYIFNSTGYRWGVWDQNSACSSVAEGTIYANSQGGMNGTWNDKITHFKRR